MRNNALRELFEQVATANARGHRLIGDWLAYVDVRDMVDTAIAAGTLAFDVKAGGYFIPEPYLEHFRNDPHGALLTLCTRTLGRSADAVCAYHFEVSSLDNPKITVKIPSYNLSIASQDVRALRDTLNLVLDHGKT